MMTIMMININIPMSKTLQLMNYSKIKEREHIMYIYLSFSHFIDDLFTARNGFLIFSKYVIKFSLLFSFPPSLSLSLFIFHLFTNNFLLLRHNFLCRYQLTVNYDFNSSKIKYFHEFSIDQGTQQMRFIREIAVNLLLRAFLYLLWNKLNYCIIMFLFSIMDHTSIKYYTIFTPGCPLVSLMLSTK